MKGATVAFAVVVAAIVVGAGFFVTQQGPTDSSVSQTSSRTMTTLVSTITTFSTSMSSTGGSTSGAANSTDGLQLQLKLDFYLGAGVNGSSMVSMTVDEYNLRVSSSNVSTSSSWAVNGLSDGPCGTFDLPYGVAIYSGLLTGANLTEGQLQPLQIHPPVACPMMARYVTGYLFQPSSDMALIPPGTGNATQMLSVVNATGIYSPMANSTVSPGMGATFMVTAFPAGNYTAVAADEWGALVVLHFTIEPSGIATPG